MFAAVASVASVACVALVAAARSENFTLPIVRLPAPAGRWPIGTVPMAFADTVSSRRPLEVQLWYPAAARSRGPRAPYLLAANRPMRARVLGAIVATDAQLGGPVAEARFPVVLYVPGWDGYREDNTAQAQNLASNGYVVAAIDDENTFAKGLDFSSDLAVRGSLDTAARKLRLGTDDVIRLIDALATLTRTPGGMFTGRLDLNRLGIFGFAFGGAVAAEATRYDPRIRAAANMDGWMFGETLGAGVARPYMVFNSTEPALDPARRRRDRFSAANDARIAAGLRSFGGYSITIERTGHYSYTDSAVLPSLRRSGLGSIDGRLGYRIAAGYLVQFFDRYLKYRAAPLLDGKIRLDAAARLTIFPRRPTGRPPE